MGAHVGFGAGATTNPSGKTVRIAAAQPRARLIDWHLKDVDEVLKRVDQSLGELSGLIDRAAAEHCDAVALPEDTLGLGTWEAGNEVLAREVLPRAVKAMLAKLGAAGKQHGIYVVCCNDFVEADGHTYNTAFLIGRDGKEIGRYHKVCPTIHERVCTPGDRFPVFETKDLGGVGMLICYDMVFPETARCLALGGADVIFHPTLGGAAIGDDEISKAAFRTRAAENFVYIVVAQRGSGSMIISPQGKILAEAQGADSLAIAEINPFGGREGGDAMNQQRDMRARLFRERNPAAFGRITDANPPVLSKIPATISEREAVEVAHRVLTVGQEEFKAADVLVRDGKIEAAAAAFGRLQKEYRDSWIDRVSTQRLAMLESKLAARVKNDEPAGIAEKYHGDRGIEKDPRVVFVEDFEEGTIDALSGRWEDVKAPQIMSFAADVPQGSSGRQSLLMTHVGGKGDGGHLYRRLPKGLDQAYARFYVKFDPDCAPIHHFGTCIGGNNPATRWPMVKAGIPPAGDKGFWTGIEPFGESWRWDFYTYWCEMRGSPPRGQTWGNSFVRDESLKVERGRWICVEVMVKMNDLGESNGEMALWIDGRAISHLGKGFPKGKWVFDKFMANQGGESVRWNNSKGDRENFQTAAGGEPFEGFRWRTAKELDVNCVWAYLYITGAPAGHVSKVWFDHIVVASEYIGPIRNRN
ncbi:MAG TPA: carbon-nitrogen hydrolase family protein [Tepidisphaeraceae bacterium]|nr:carbon-nitrogen hydrolase family protein [Tepidisphaeraceae bacterium]